MWWRIKIELFQNRVGSLEVFLRSVQNGGGSFVGEFGWHVLSTFGWHMFSKLGSFFLFFCDFRNVMFRRNVGVQHRKINSISKSLVLCWFPMRKLSKVENKFEHATIPPNHKHEDIICCSEGDRFDVLVHSQ